MPLTPKKQEKEKKEVSLKELFQGTTLDSSIERARVKGLDEFLNKSDPSKPVIKSALSRIFQAYNPGVDPEVIDWDAVSDTNLSIPENREIFAAEYPQYRWYGEEEENPFTQELLRVVNEAREAGLTNRQISASIAQVRKEIGLGQSKQLGQAKQKAQLEEIKRRLAEAESELAKLKTKPQVEPRPNPEELESLYNQFRLAIKARLGKEPTNAEYDQFTSCVEAAPTLTEARNQCQRLIDLLTPKQGRIQADLGSPALISQELARGIELPSWAQYLQNRLLQQAAEEQRKRERGEAREATHLLAVLNSKTEKIQTIKFYSKEQMDSYIKSLPSTYEYTTLKGDSSYERTGFGKSKSKR